MTSDHKVAMFTRSLSVQSGAAPAAVDGAGPVAAVLGLAPEQIWAEAVKYRAANVPSVFTISEKASIQSLNSVLNVKALVGTFNQEKALVGAFSVIVKTSLINRLQL